MASKDFKFQGAYGGKKKMGKKMDKKMGPKNYDQMSGRDPHAMQDKWQDKQMKMLSKPKKMMKKGGNPFKGM